MMLRTKGLHTLYVNLKGDNMNTNIPRPEHPQPQWERTTWQNLNGSWEFEFDFGTSAIERKLWEKEQFDREIIVPFCPESRLSGIGYTDFIPGVAYRRHFEITADKLTGKILLHFGAVDYLTDVYVNGVHAGQHKGGYTSFTIDITSFVKEGDNTLFVAASDDVRGKMQPKGKQANRYYSSGCDYTRTTGIWQTVWLEFVPLTNIQSAKYYANLAESCLNVTGITEGAADLTLTATWDGKVVGSKTLSCQGGFFSTQLELSELHLWEAGKGGLYELTLTYGDDTVKSYFGMRTTGFEGRKYMLNGKSLFQRTVIDQGFYPEGIYTAPTDADLIKDIELSYAAGFNGARLHQKVFEARFLYHCDRLGYLVWGEYPNWGLDHANPQAAEIYLNEWTESMERDFNHPAIIGWCPFNETWGYWECNEKNALLSSIYKVTKLLDPTRPCVDTSGNFHSVTEIYDIHDYDQDVTTFKARWEAFAQIIKDQNGVIEASDKAFKTAPLANTDGGLVHGAPLKPFFNQAYHNQPIFVSEYGGIQWVKNAVAGWGYGQAPKTEEEFFARYKGLTDALLDNGEIFGFCYTQLYDIEQEINGIYTYEREAKYDINIIKEINERAAKIEQ